MSEPLNDTWLVVSYEAKDAHSPKPRQVYYQGPYKACVDYVATIKSGRIEKLFRSLTRPPETDKETIQRLGYLAPLDYAKRLRQ